VAIATSLLSTIYYWPSAAPAGVAESAELSALLRGAVEAARRREPPTGADSLPEQVTLRAALVKPGEKPYLIIARVGINRQALL